MGGKSIVKEKDADDHSRMQTSDDCENGEFRTDHGSVGSPTPRATANSSERYERLLDRTAKSHESGGSSRVRANRANSADMIPGHQRIPSCAVCSCRPARSPVLCSRCDGLMGTMLCGHRHHLSGGPSCPTTRVSLMGGCTPSPLSIGATVKLISSNLPTPGATSLRAAQDGRGLTHVIGSPDVGGSVCSWRSSEVTEACPQNVCPNECDHGVLVLDRTEVESLTRFSHRVTWLVLLLFVQSISSFILKSFETLITERPVVVFFLTMLIGAGGNAGSQSTVLAIRAIARKELETGPAMAKFVVGQVYIGFKLSYILCFVSFIRVWLFDANIWEVAAICASMFTIVFVSVFLGTLMPLVFRWFGSDPAHAGAAIQVTMDIIGVGITCLVSTLLLLVLMPRQPSNFSGSLHGGSVLGVSIPSKPLGEPRLVGSGLLPTIF